MCIGPNSPTVDQKTESKLVSADARDVSAEQTSSSRTRARAALQFPFALALAALSATAIRTWALSGIGASTPHAASADVAVIDLVDPAPSASQRADYERRDQSNEAVELSSGEDARRAALESAASGRTTSPALDVSPEKGCSTVTYTPPDASAPQLGDLCIPERLTGTIAVLVHGGGGTGGTRTDTQPWAQWYQDRGFATLSVDYHLLDVGAGEAAWPRPEQNVKAAVQYAHAVRSALGLERVVIHGWSAGARLAAVALTTSGDPQLAGNELHKGLTDRVDAAVLFYGYYDGMVFEPDLYFADGLSPAAVPLANAAAATGAVFLSYGVGDFLVPTTQSDAFAAALRAAGIEVSTSISPDTPTHAFDGYASDEISAEGLVVAAELEAFLQAPGAATA